MTNRKKLKPAIVFFVDSLADQMYTTSCLVKQQVAKISYDWIERIYL